MMFKVPNKKERLNAIGPLTNSKSKSLTKILSTADDYHSPISPPENGDWLSSQKERGQTFSQFMSEWGNSVNKNRQTIYINPLQKMDQNFLDSLLLYCQSFFYPMKLKLINLSSLASLKVEHRINKYTKKIQYNAGEINLKISKLVPNDAHCVLSILYDDLYPKKEWNFVFGLASYSQRVGVFSIARFNPSFYGDIEPDNINNYILHRACSTFVHEICHTFGLNHCIYYKCLLNGSNNSEEQEKRPLIECPVCLRKLQYSIGFEPIERYKKLMDVNKILGGYFENEFKWYENRINSLSN